MQGVPRMEIESWISRNVNRYWGRIIEAKNKEQRRLLAEIAKYNVEEEKKVENIEPQNKDIEEELEYPL